MDGLTNLQGLRSSEAAVLLKEHGPNELPSAKPRGALALLWEVISEPMLLLLLAAGSVNFLLAELFDGVILMAVVLIVVAISIVQMRRTEQALTALRELSSPRAHVLRDGQAVRISAREVVPGDLLLVAEGDRIAADAVLVRAVNLGVDESTLTGEAIAVQKSHLDTANATQPMGPAGGDGTPYLFYGTLVVRGQGVALVQRTGESTELGRIGAALRDIENSRTPLQREVDRLVRVVALIGILAAVAVAVVYGLTRGDWLEGVLAAIAAAMSLLPEEFPVILTVFLALGAWRMSKRNVLARRSAVIETLGSATVLCVDKTGTLTMNQMAVREFIVDGNSHVVDEQPLPPQFWGLAEVAVLASPVDPFDPMDKAFHQLAASYLEGTGKLHPQWKLVREYPLTENLMAMTHVWRGANEPGFVVAAKGAPEAIARICRLSAAEARKLDDTVARATVNGQRVLAVARANWPYGSALPDEIDEYQFTLVGLVGLHDPVRPGVEQSVRQCAAAGVRTIMITGDYPGTALAVAAAVGIESEAGALTGADVQTLSDAELQVRVRDVNVFARMVPAQKLRLVRALQANDEIVGMTGDGVNDAPALKAANIGIAMGARGTDVARESAALVITDDDFRSIAEGVRLGRGIFSNIRKAMSYVLAVHVSIVGMALIPVFVSDWPLVLLPLQIAFLELIIDPACSVVFESEEIDPEIMNQPPRAATEPIFTKSQLVFAALQGLSGLVMVMAVFLWALTTGRSDTEVRTLAFVTLVFGNLALILVNRSSTLSALTALRRRNNRTLKWIFGAAISSLLILVAVPEVANLMKLSPITAADWLLCLGAAAVGVSWVELRKAFRRRSLALH